MGKYVDNYGVILKEAHDAATAVMAIMQEGTGLDCGFAWVTISGNEPLARYCRAQSKITIFNGYKFYGDKGYPSGWRWWGPGAYSGQSIGIHEAGARAFRDVLAKYGIVATVGSRYD